MQLKARPGRWQRDEEYCTVKVLQPHQSPDPIACPRLGLCKPHQILTVRSKIWVNTCACQLWDVTQCLFGINFFGLQASLYIFIPIRDATNTYCWQSILSTATIKVESSFLIIVSSVSLLYSPFNFLLVSGHPWRTLPKDGWFARVSRDASNGLRKRSEALHAVQKPLWRRLLQEGW